MLGEAANCVKKEYHAASIFAMTKGYSSSLRHLKRAQRLALEHPQEMFLKDDHHNGSTTTDRKFILHKLRRPTTRVTDLFTQFNFALDRIGMG